MSKVGALVFLFMLSFIALFGYVVYKAQLHLYGKVTYSWDMADKCQFSLDGEEKVWFIGQSCRDAKISKGIYTNATCDFFTRECEKIEVN